MCSLVTGMEAAGIRFTVDTITTDADDGYAAFRFHVPDPWQPADTPLGSSICVPHDLPEDQRHPFGDACAAHVRRVRVA